MCIAGLSYPDSVCTELAMSVVEESYDERTPLYAAQELGRRFRLSVFCNLSLQVNECQSMIMIKPIEWNLTFRLSLAALDRD